MALNNIAPALTLSASISSVSATLNLSAATTNWPAPNFFAQLSDSSGASELVYVTAKASTTFTVTRGAGGTSAAPWGAGTVVRLVVVAEHLASGATSVADGGTVTHGMSQAPTVVTPTASVAGEFVSVTAISSTTFTVAIKKHDGSAGTTQTIYWRASV